MTADRGTGEVDVSIILPTYNEEACVETLALEIDTVLDQLGVPAEILFVDDASTDATPVLLATLARMRPRIRTVRHTINSGESAGQATGFAVARGRRLVTMDADGQNDPADVPALLAALEHADVVCGVRRRREDDWVKRLSSRIGNGFRNLTTGVAVKDAGCTYRALRREALAELPVFNGMHRFLPTLLQLQGWRVVEIEVNHRPRAGGSSKYGIGNRLWRGLIDCLVMRWWRRRAVPGRRLAPSVAEPQDGRSTPTDPGAVADPVPAPAPTPAGERP